MSMSRKWLRVAACVTLAAFLVANGLPSAHARPMGCPCRQAGNEPATAAPTAEPAPSGCKHCRAKERQAGASIAQTNLDQPDGSPGRSCPCQDPGSCPCPGGCIFCSVAKVPCCAPVAAVTVLMPCLGQKLLEDSLLFPPPHGGKLIRPPRA